jgi:uncharacterized protein YqjF (DUF2071 family)
VNAGELSRRLWENHPNYMGLEMPFLTAHWRHLAMLNYEVDPGLLRKFVPRGTELDRWKGRVFVSLVGFRFLNTKVRGIAIPFHRNFDEVNLRLYVRRRDGPEERRGVVFIREVVPRRAIAFVARTVYHENYVAVPMEHDIRQHDDGGIDASYRWRSGTGWAEIRFESQGAAQALEDGSEEQFIAEHYWGYAAQPDGGCVEYQVTHPSWRVWQSRRAGFEGKVDDLYGPEFAEVLGSTPASAFLAEGSAVAVMRGRRL